MGWQGSSQNAVSAETFDLFGVEDLGDRTGVVLPHRDAALLEVLEAVRNEVGRDPGRPSLLGDVAVPGPELRGVRLGAEEEVPVLVEVVAGHVVVVRVEPLPEHERVVEILGLVAADAEAGMVGGLELDRVGEQLVRVLRRRRDPGLREHLGVVVEQPAAGVRRDAPGFPAVLAGGLDGLGDVGEVPRRGGLGRVVHVCIERLDALDADVAADVLGAREEDVERLVLRAQLERDLLVHGRDRLLDVVDLDPGLLRELGHERLVEVELGHRSVGLERDRRARVRLSGRGSSGGRTRRGRRAGAGRRGRRR